MSSPVFGAMGGQGGNPNMMDAFKQFRSQMGNIDPRQKVQEMLNGGKANQQQVNQLQQMLQQNGFKF